MFSQIKKIHEFVGKSDEYISCITPRLWAISNPSASLVEKLHYSHGDNFWVFNIKDNPNEVPISFNTKMTSFFWRDYFSPSLVLLLDICANIHNFLLKDTKNVVYIHSSSDKGRVATVITCYLLFCGFSDTAENAIAYYGRKRFGKGLGVT